MKLTECRDSCENLKESIVPSKKSRNYNVQREERMKILTSPGYSSRTPRIGRSTEFMVGI